jgi:hypothetical protein
MVSWNIPAICFIVVKSFYNPEALITRSAKVSPAPNHDLPSKSGGVAKHPAKGVRADRVVDQNKFSLLRKLLGAIGLTPGATDTSIHTKPI